MSVSISYTQLTKTYLKGVTSRTVSALEEVFGEPPWRLGLGQLDQLNAMAAVHGSGHNPYSQLADIIEQFAIDLLVTPEH
jgi:hypothetical protein